MGGLALLSLIFVPVGLGLTIAGLFAFFRSVDPLHVESELWIGDLVQGAIAAVAALTLLAVGLASDDRFFQKAALAAVGIETAAIWLLWAVDRLASHEPVALQPSVESPSTSRRKEAA